MVYNFHEIQVRFRELKEENIEIQKQLDELYEIFETQEPDLEAFYLKSKNLPGIRAVRVMRKLERSIKLLKTDLIRHRKELSIIKGTRFEETVKPIKRRTKKDPNRFTSF